MKDVLFEVTKDQLETGMRGYPVGYCTTSYVDPKKGLFYKGRPISELHKWEPERVIYLLFHGKEGASQEIASFSKDLVNRGHCSQAVIRHIEQLPRQGHPMKMFSAAVLILGMLEGQGDYKEDCLNLIAKVPHLAALVINHHAGWGETPLPNSEMGYMENFCQMVQMPQKEEDLSEVLRLFNILHYDHGGGNLSTFVGKAVASGHEDLYGAIGAAMCALSGSRHGKANQECLYLIEDLLKEVGADGPLEKMEDAIRKHLQEDHILAGFGHAVLRAEDARATILYDLAKEKYGEHLLIKVALQLREQGHKILKENPKVSDPYPNIDAISGALLSAAGFAHPDYFTVLFGMSRSVGIAIQVVYERCFAKGGKGTPIIRPRYLYTS